MSRVEGGEWRGDGDGRTTRIRRRRAGSTTTTTNAIRLEHVLMPARGRKKSVLVYNLVLVGVILFTTRPISTWARALPPSSVFDQHQRKHAQKTAAFTTSSRKEDWLNDQPPKQHLEDKEAAAYDDSLQTYLTEFGYLPKNNPEVSNLRSDVVISSAISRLQEYAGLNVTSKLDGPTKRLMHSKRCGMADIPYDGGGGIRAGGRRKRYTIFGEKWNKLRLTYKVVNHSPYIDHGQTRRTVHDALKLWSDASALEFAETADDGADILIEFRKGDHGDSYPFDGPNVVLAHAFFPGSGRGGDAHFDDDEVWTNEPASVTRHNYEKVNLFSVAAHEFGHSLGLGHSRDRNALMFAYYKDLSHLTQLPYDDTLAVQKLYGVGKTGVPEAPPPTSPPHHAPPPPRHPPPVNPPGQPPRPPPPYYPTDAPPPEVTTPLPDACHSEVDAVARIRQEIFVFKGSYFWRFADDGSVTSNAVEINRFWQGFPNDFAGVDAVFERPHKDTIVFFKGRLYWEFQANFALPGYPRDIGSLGMPDDVFEVDAAFVYSWSKKPYLFAGDRYWRLDENTLRVEHDYPRRLDEFWTGVPSGVDAAFTDKYGANYFLKDSEVFKFSDHFMRVANGYPIKISEFWPHCRATDQQHLQHRPNSKYSDQHGNGSSSGSSRPLFGLNALLFFTLSFVTHVIFRTSIRVVNSPR